MTRLFPWALEGLGSFVLKNIFLLLLLVSFNFLQFPCIAQPTQSVGLEAYGLETEILPVPGTKDDWVITLKEDSSYSLGKEIQSLSVQITGILPFDHAALTALFPGNHAFNVDGKANWSIVFDPVSSSFTVKGERPEETPTAGTGTLFSLTLTQTGIPHQDKAIVCAGGLVIADVAIGAKRSTDLNIEIGPNPANEYIDIRGADSDHLTARLFSLSGEVLQEMKLTTEGTQRWWLDRLKPGIYPLVIYDRDVQVKVVRLVKQ